jgi:cytolysin-activating lysine-acyltransferase
MTIASPAAKQLTAPSFEDHPMPTDSFDFNSKLGQPRTSSAPPSQPTAATAAAPSIPIDRARAMANLKMSAEAGEIVAILARSPTYRAMTLGDVETLVRPVLASRQFCISRSPAAQAGNAAATPSAAIAFWAFVSDEVDQRLTASAYEPIRLAPSEWRSGPHAWLVDLVGEKTAIGPMLRQLGAVVLKEHTVKMRHRNPDGTWTIKTLPKAN